MAHYNRAQWGARQARPGGNTPTNGPKGVAFHYNGPAMGINPAGPCQCAARVRQIQAFHIDGRGWADIAYDVIACPHGNTFQGRLNTGKGTAANGSNTANRDYMAVMALIGGTEKLGDPLKRAMLAGRALCRAAGAGPQITPHSQHEKTACPGEAISQWIRAGAPAPSTTTPKDPAVITDFLFRGVTGPQVRLLQQILNAVNAAGLTVDGSFGPAVEAAVRKYQASRQLQVDGKVGPVTRKALNASWDAFTTPKPPAPDPANPPAPGPAPDPSELLALADLADDLARRIREAAAK